MLINNININQFGATYLRSEWGDTEITNISDWLNGSHAPKLYRQYIRYSNLSITFLIDAQNNATLENYISRITAEMAKVVIAFDNMPQFFEGTAESREITKINPTAAEITFTLKGQRLGATQITNLPAGAGTYLLNGNCEVPCRITAQLSTSGAVNITINNHQYTFDGGTGTLIIDAFNGVITLDNVNVMDKWHPYSFPSVKGGVNNINTNVPITIEARGRWQ